MNVFLFIICSNLYQELVLILAKLGYVFIKDELNLDKRNSWHTAPEDGSFSQFIQPLFLCYVQKSDCRNIISSFVQGKMLVIC